MGQQNENTGGAGQRNTPDQDRNTGNTPRGQQPDNTGNTGKDAEKGKTPDSTGNAAGKTSPDADQKREKGHEEQRITGHTEGDRPSGNRESTGTDQSQGRK